MTSLTFLAYDFADSIKSSDDFKSLIKINKEIETTLKDEINEYVKVKEEYEEVLKYGSYHPDFKEKANKFRDLKVKLYTNPLMIRQKELYEKIEDVINSLIKDMTSNISENIPVLNEIGFISKKGGGISCGS